MRYQGSRYIEADDLFGLSVTDLTDEQLEKLQVHKLIGLFEKDPRIASVLTQKLVNLDAEQLRLFSPLESKEWESNPDLKAAYNKRIASTNWNQYYSRSYYVFWSGLNDERKLAELKLLITSKASVASLHSLDYSWLCNADLGIARDVFGFALKHGNTCLPNLISGASKEVFLEFLPALLARTNNQQLDLLRSPFIPEIYLDKLLRVYAKLNKSGARFIKAPISSAVLRALPPITRLQTLEGLVIESINLHQTFDVKNVDDFKTFTFAALTKYPDRVIDLCERFVRRWEEEISATTIPQPIPEFSTIST
jgi:hypothetical protein